LIICPKCKEDFDISNENVEAVTSKGETIGWQHKKCEDEKSE